MNQRGRSTFENTMESFCYLRIPLDQHTCLPHKLAIKLDSWAILALPQNQSLTKKIKINHRIREYPPAVLGPKRWASVIMCARSAHRGKKKKEGFCKTQGRAHQQIMCKISVEFEFSELGLLRICKALQSGTLAKI